MSLIWIVGGFVAATLVALALLWLAYGAVGERYLKMRMQGPFVPLEDEGHPQRKPTDLHRPSNRCTGD